MKTTEVSFDYPVLGFFPGPIGYSREPDVHAFADFDALTSEIPDLFKRTRYVGVELVDSSCRRWIVRSARQAGWAKSRLHWLLLCLLSPPMVRIEHELEELEPLSLDEIKSRTIAVCEAEDRRLYDEDDKADWYGQDQLRHLSDEIANARRAESISELIKAFGL